MYSLKRCLLSTCLSASTVLNTALLPVPQPLLVLFPPLYLLRLSSGIVPAPQCSHDTLGVSISLPSIHSSPNDVLSPWNRLGAILGAGDAAVSLGDRNTCPHGASERRQTACKIISDIYGIIAINGKKKTKVGKELACGRVGRECCLKYPGRERHPWTSGVRVRTWMK